MVAAADRGWGDPGRQHGDAKAREYGRRHITTIETADGSRFSIRKEVAPIFLGFLNEIIGRGYRIKGDVLDDWGWYVRLISGTDTLSNHAHGLAVDVNALTNPQGKVLRTDMPGFVAEAAARWGLRWGGTYRSRPDAMHFEWTGTRAAALKFVQDLEALFAARQEDDMFTDDDRKKLDEIHAAMFRGAPEFGVAPMNVAVNEIHFGVAGVDLPRRPSRIKQLLAKAGIKVEVEPA